MAMAWAPLGWLFAVLSFSLLLYCMPHVEYGAISHDQSWNISYHVIMIYVVEPSKGLTNKVERFTPSIAGITWRSTAAMAL
jgi:hypothetical protein